MKKNVAALLGLLALFVTVSASAQTKMSGTITCTKAEPSYKMDAGDRPGHAYMLEKHSCTWTQAPEIGGAKSKDGVSISTTEVTSTHGMTRGTHVTTMESGDKTFVAFHDEFAVKDGKPADSNGHWTYTGGTGKLKGLKGKGTYKATPNPDGTITVAVEGEYELPAAAPAAK